MVLAAALMLIEKRFYDTTAYVTYVSMMVLLAVTIIIAPDTKGSHSWLPIGSSVKIQPAEFAKFSVALALGKLMDRYGYSIKKLKDIGTAIGIILLPMLLIIAQKETGSALVYFAFFLMLYREGMTGSLLFTGFACVTYFVVGMKFSESYIANMPVSIGEFTVLLLAMIFTIGMVWVYCKNLFAVKLMAYICFGGTLL